MSGLSPSLWVSVGGEFSREDLKQQLFSADVGFTADAFTDLDSLCAKIIGVSSGRILSPLARREGLRLLLGKRTILARLPEMRRLKRQRSFLKKLDRALQAGRLAFAHDQEREVIDGRIEALNGSNPVRSEIEFMATVYQAWLESADLWDQARLLEAATLRLDEGWPVSVPKPEELRLLTYQKPESRLVAFLGALEQQGVSVNWAGERELETPDSPEWSWRRWHTVDDSVEFLVRELVSAPDLSNEIVLIPDDAGVKRSLKRALVAAGLPLADPRDNLALRQDEKIKAALLPIQMVAGRFERELVVSWIRCFQNQSQSQPQNQPSKLIPWVTEIYSRGIQDGLPSYGGGKLVELHRELTLLGEQLGRKMLLEELAETHLRLLAGHSALAGVQAFFGEFWATWIEEQELLGETARLSPIVYWWERIRDRLEGSMLRPDRSRPAEGVQVYRLSQAVPFDARPGSRVWMLGIPSNHLDSPVGDYWYSVRDRDVLAAEFPVRSSHDSRRERLAILTDWAAWAGEVQVCDVLFDWNGKERETPAALLRKLPGFALEAPVEMGAALRWLPSYGGARTVQPQVLRLPIRVEGPEKKAVLDATELDHLSRCAFQWVGLDRWKLRDLEEPDIELPPNIKGNILHAAAELLIRARNNQGIFSRSAEEVLEEVWKTKGLRGLLRGKRLEGYVKATVLKVLHKFMADEEAYVLRSRTQVLSLEDDTRLELELPEGRVHGRPDRIDEHPEGLFLIDYKSTANVPTGRKMLDEGYRLQLAFYSLAAARKFGKPLIGAQFVSLVPAGGRNRGIFFSKWNGAKVEGALTLTTAANRSLFADLGPEEVWSGFEERIRDVLRSYLSGEFRVAPKDPASECRSCTLQDVCGRNRLVAEDDEAAS